MSLELVLEKEVMDNAKRYVRAFQTEIWRLKKVIEELRKENDDLRKQLKEASRVEMGT